ncbi:MAG: amidase [Acidobacteria bacterium]|nr:amidase [Acidobacteriota bacterium]
MKNPRAANTAEGTNTDAKLNRRSFVKLLPAAGAAGLTITAPDSAAAQTRGVAGGGTQQDNQRITREMMQAAEKLIGVELTEAQENMALPGVNRNLANYEALRKIDVPLDTEPATAFHPALPGKLKTYRQRAAKSSKAAKSAASKSIAPKFTSVENLAFATVAELSELVRTHKLSSMELTKMYLGRLKKYGDKLLNVVTLTEELALKQAEAADREIKAGKYRGPLHGIPCGVKDLFATKGIKTTWGAEPFQEQMIDYDSTVVERLREAGAVLVAKLSMGALAQGGRWFKGMTRNPWQPEETAVGSSGSSAGSASATSAGLVGFAIGTETLGSIVSPSSRCGVTGLRPTYGRVSRYGAMGLSWTMDKIGPICRSVEDCALVLAAIYGPDGHDMTVEDVPFHWDSNRPLSQMRIGYIQAEFEPSGRQNGGNQGGQGNAEERRKMYADALDVLRKAGAKLEPFELPQFNFQSLRTILNAEAAAAFDDITRDGRVNQLSGQSPNDWPNSFRTARFIPAVEYIRAQRARTLLMREMDKLMANWDCFVTPAPGSASLTLTNLTGHPAVVVPCGFINKLPQAIMFTGNLYDEAAPLRVAHAFQQATDWHKKYPNLD